MVKNLRLIVAVWAAYVALSIFGHAATLDGQPPAFGSSSLENYNDLKLEEAEAFKRAPRTATITNPVTVNALVGTSAAIPVATLVGGEEVSFIAGATSTGASTFALDSTSAIALTDPTGTALASGAIINGTQYKIRYVLASNQWRVLSGLVVASGGTPGGTSGQIQYNNAGAFAGFTTTGDVVITPSTGATVIQSGVVTNTKQANMNASTIKGNNAATGPPVDLTVAQTKTLLAIVPADITGLGALATLSTVSLSTQATGVLQAAQEPAHTGDMTNTAGSLTTAVNSIGGKSVTLAGNLTTTGAFNTTFAQAATTTQTLPAATDTLVGRASTDTLTNKTYDTAGAGNSLLIAGVGVTANTGTGAMVRTASPAITSPTLTTPAIGSAGASFAGATSGTTSVIATAIAGSTTVTLPAATDTLVGKATTDTLTNKTIDTAAPNTIKINGNSLAATAGTATVTIPNVTDTLANLTSAQTLTSKTLTSPVLTTPAIGTAGATFAGSTSGTTSVAASATASGVLTLPAATDTLTGKATTDTLTNKTIDTAGTGNSFKIAGTAITAISGTGSVCMTTSCAMTTPNLGTPSAATLTSATGLPISTGVSGLGTGTATALGVNVGTAGAVVTNGGALGTPSSGTGTNFTGVPISTGISGLGTGVATGLANAATGSGAPVLGTTPTIATPVINGLPTGTGVAATATASTLVARDANGSISTVNYIAGFTTTATATATTTLTVASNQINVFTGTLTQTVTLPTTSIMAGQRYLVVNLSTGAVTVQSSGANTIVALAPNTSAWFYAVVATPTTAANWTSQYLGAVIASGKSLSVNNTLTLAGTDATTMTFPTTSATIARTDAANTFTGVQTMTSPALTTPNIAGLATGTGVASAATASTLATRDTNANILANNFLANFATTVTAAGTTTLTVSSPPLQFFTGTTTQTVTLPVSSTLVLGQSYTIVNQSSGAVTVNSSGANLVQTVAAGNTLVTYAVLITGTTQTSWGSYYVSSGSGTGTVTSVTCGTGLTGGTFTTVGTCANPIGSAIAQANLGGM